MQQVFHAKVSYGLLALVVLSILTCIAPLLTEAWEDWFWVLLIFTLLLEAFILHLFLFTRYTIVGDSLQVRSGWIRYPAIPIAQITLVKPTKSILSAPAPSFKRLAVCYNRYDELIVSPKQAQAFVAALQAINPNIKSEI